MRILYVIFVLCVAALLFTVLAAARHIRRHEEKRKTSPDDKLAEAGELATRSKVLIPAGKTRGN